MRSNRIHHSLQHAVEGLEEADVVLGPAVDGGFYLIASRATDPGMFAGVEWSTEGVLEGTMGAVAQLGWSCRMDMPVLQDIGEGGCAGDGDGVRGTRPRPRRGCECRCLASFRSYLAPLRSVSLCRHSG